MKSFLQRHDEKIIGTLSGFDRLRLRGTLRWLANFPGMLAFLSTVRVLLKDFKGYALTITANLRQRALEMAEAVGRPVIYLQSSLQDKEALAREIAHRDDVTEGLIAVLKCVEPCRTYKVGPNRETKKLELRSFWGKCLHVYYYYMDPQWGLMHARLQTWFPFTIHVCLNGREWLAKQMDKHGISYVRRENCFTALADVAKAQALLDQQLRLKWEKRLNELAGQINPEYRRLYQGQGLDYYWSADESEWATDVLFRSPEALQELYPSLIHHGLTTVSSGDVMRFLGKKVPAHGQVNGNFVGEVVTDTKRRPEGVRIKHRINRNSIKMYDKQGSVLRVETTINDARDMKSYRAKEGDPQGKKAWRRLRKGISDLHRRTEISQAANERYLQSLAAMEATTSLGELTQALCHPVQWQGKRVRALQPLHPEELRWLAAVNRGEFLINGFRNRDLRGLLFHPQPESKEETRRQSAKVTRILRLLRAHGLIQKVTKTHRYLVSARGKETIGALLSARQADAKKLVEAAA